MYLIFFLKSYFESFREVNINLEGNQKPYELLLYINFIPVIKYYLLNSTK